MALSEYTVNHYLNRATRKLDSVIASKLPRRYARA